jgi:hypothetical protein
VTPRDLKLVVLGVCAGVFVTVVMAALVWPENRTGNASAPITMAPPSVRPTPTVGAPTESADASTPEADDATSTPWPSNGHPSSAPPLADAAPAGKGSLPDASPVSCPAPTQRVATGAELTRALARAVPGDSIQLSSGRYTGAFTATAKGTADRPIFLCGPRDAVLDDGDVKGDYVFHLDGATYWRLVGFTVTNGQKGVVADKTHDSVIQGLTVRHVGDEGIHLRDNSTDNVVLDNSVRDTGLRRDKFGEGVYVGSAVSNWCRYSDCGPDRSDRNVVKDNTITGVRAEAVDVKEGTTGGVVDGNTFDGSDITGADSWVDVKGNNWLVVDNTGRHAPKDGFQTHQILDGWGDHNVFSGNRAVVDGPGFGIASWPEEANVVACDNKVSGAREGLSNIACSS